MLSASITIAASEGVSNLTVFLGFVFVIAVLAFLAGITQVLGFIFARTGGATAAKAPAAPAKPIPAKPAPVAGSEESPELVAIIAAAVHATLGEPHRILSIKRSSDRTWAAEGRREIFRSHKVR